VADAAYAPAQARRGPDAAVSAAARRRAVLLDGGEFLMGGDAADGYPADGEGPVHQVRLSPFGLDPHAVTTDRFAEFVAATGHVTDAERFGWSFVFGGLLPDDFPPTHAVAHAPWWRQVYGACWRHPEGPQSDLADRGDHPVVHVSWYDALAFCAWSGTRLPTEAEWEYAARGGAVRQRFPWGSEREPEGEHRMNVFQGRFPGENSCADGFAATAPVSSFPANGYGLNNMTGNVWEWCADWFDPGYYRRTPVENPPGPPGGTHRVMRGGSYLCHASYCNRYRVDARSGNEPCSSTGNLGFRVVSDVSGENGTSIHQSATATSATAPTDSDTAAAVSHITTGEESSSYSARRNAPAVRC
jgi:formylglycine-generating enzyme